MTKTKGVSVFTVAATYVGTVVGAGFATGQEVLKFFTHFGLGGIYGVIGATALFAVLGALILQIGLQLGAESHEPVVEAVVGPVVGRLVDYVIIFFLFGGAAVMMAGSGAVFAEHWHLNRTLGTIAMAVLSGGTVLLGLRGVVRSISAVAPILILMVLVICISAIVRNGIPAEALRWYQPGMAATAQWPVSLFLYVSYNLLLSISVLGPLGKETRSPSVAYWGGILGGVALGVGTLFIHLALLSGLPETAGYEVPMLGLARAFPAWMTGVYSVVLWAEVYTTAVASLYGLTARLTRPGTTRSNIFVVGATAGALLASQFGFSRMVGVLFPAVGWLGLVFVAGLIWRLFSPLERTVR